MESYTNSHLLPKRITHSLKLIAFFLLTCLWTQNVTAQAACGTCATANCIGIKQYANKTAVLTGTGKVWKTYSPALTSATGSFTVYVTITTDAWGQVGVMQELQCNGTSTGLTTQVQNVAATRTSVLYALSDATCSSAIFPANIGNDGCSTTYNPAWTNLQPNTSYKLALTSNLSGLAAGYTYTGFNIRFYNAVRPIASFAYNCGAATYLGTFTANGVAGQQGALSVPITGATAGTATLTVTGAGFTGTVTTNVAAGQTSITVPITYDGTGTAGARTLTITSLQGTGACTPSVIVDPLLSVFAFNCATASNTGTYIANNTAGQTGTITIPLSNATLGQASFTVSGNGFSGSFTTTLTAGQPSVTFPISYNGSGVAGNHFVTINSTQASGTCSKNILVAAPAGSFTFNCGSASVIGNFVANGSVGQGGYVTIPITSGIAGTSTFTVSGAGFAGSLTTTITTNQTQVSVPIFYDGSGAAGSIPLSITSTNGTGACSVNATVASALPLGAITFNCPATAPVLGNFVANGTTQNGLLSVNFTTQTAGQVTFSISGGGFSGSYVASVVAGQTSVTMVVNYDGSGVQGNHAVTVVSSQATGVCAMTIPVKGLFDFTCANYNTSSSFIANGTSQNGTLVIPLSNVSAGSATFTASGNGFTGTLTTVLQDSQRFVAIPVVYDGSGVIGTHPVTITSTQGVGTCTANVKVKDPATGDCDYLIGQPVSFLIHSNSTQAGYLTQYILVDANGVIKYTTTTMPFTGVAEGSYEGYAVNYSGTPPNLNVGTNLTAIGGSCTSLSNALPIKMCAGYIFSCGGGTYKGAFIANGVGGQTGTLYITLLNALAIPTTITVANGGFTGSVTQTLPVGTVVVAIPVTYNGIGAGGTVLLNILGTNAAGTCTIGVDVFPPPPAVPFTFNCGTPVINGTFEANSSLQSGSVTIALTGVVAGTTDFTVTGAGFSGGLTNTVLAAGQTSITIPVIYDGRGPVGAYAITITSPHGTASCPVTIPVIGTPATFTFDCASATVAGTLAASGTAGQTATLTLNLTNATTAGTATFTVTGTGFTGTLTTTLTAGQTSVDIPITYDGTGIARTETLTVTSPEGTGTCTPSVTIACPTIAAPSITVVQPTCTVLTGSITVTSPSSGVTYSFDNGTTYQAAATLSGLAVNTYSIITKNTGTGCVSVATSTTLTAKTVPAAPTTTVTQPTCSVATGTITVTAPSTGVTYSFDNGTNFQVSAISNNLATGTYQVIVKDNTSTCESAATTTTINAQPAMPTISTVAKTDPSVLSCPLMNNGTITVTATGSNLQYSIDNGTTWQATNSFMGVSVGSYTIRVKDNLTTCAVAYTTNPVVLAAPTCPIACPVPKSSITNH
jgi:hypothetical protein